MSNQDLIEYIKKHLQSAIDEKDIKNNLLSAGWQEKDVDGAFLVAKADNANDIKVEKPKKKLWKKILKISLIVIGILVILILIPFGAPYVLRYVPAFDVPAPNDSDLMLEKVSVSDSENAFFDLIKLADVAYEPQEVADYISGKSWDDAKIADILNKNQQAFEIFDQAVKKNKYQDPAFSDPKAVSLTTELPSLQSFRKIARLSSLKSAYLMGKGKEKEAIEEAFKPIEIGQKIQNAQGSLIEYLVSLAIKQVGLERLQAIIKITKISSSDLISYISTFENYKNNEQGLIKAWKFEYLIMSDAVTDVFNDVASKELGSYQENLPGLIPDKIKTNFYFEPNKYKTILVEQARARIKDAGLNNGKNEDIFVKQIQKSDMIYQVPEEGENFLTNIVLFYKLSFTRDLIGKILRSISIASLSSVAQKKDKEDLSVEITQLMFALKVYKSDNGSYSDSLQNLAPKYISQIPPDPFAPDQPIKYSKENLTLSSEGNDAITQKKYTFSVDFGQ